MVIYSDSNLKQPNFKQGLYLISTPIGNLSDISFRSLSALANLDEIFCEDPSKTIKILNHFEINRSLKKFYEYPKGRDIEKIITLLREGKKIGIVSDAGTPTISDPGWEVVKAAIDVGVEVFSVAGPTALISALSISGLPTEKFFFAGFCPRKNKEREELFSSISASYNATLVFYETAKRINDSLIVLQKFFARKNVCLVRELTKQYEEVFRGQIEVVIESLKDRDLRGEFVLLIDNNKEVLRVPGEEVMDALKIIEAFKQDIPPSKLASKVSKLFNLSKKDAYDLILNSR